MAVLSEVIVAILKHIESHSTAYLVIQGANAAVFEQIEDSEFQEQSSSKRGIVIGLVGTSRVLPKTRCVVDNVDHVACTVGGQRQHTLSRQHHRSRVESKHKEQ